MSQQYPGSQPPQQPNGQPQWGQQPPQPYGQPPWNQQQPMYQPQQPMMPPSAPKKKSGALKWVLITLGVVLLLGIGACAIISNAVNSAVKQTTTGTISTSSTPGNTSSSPAKIGKLGDTITVDSVSCTFATVKTLAADDFVKSKAGNQFIVVHVKIHNGNTQQATYNPFDFHAKSGAGNITNEEVAPSTYTANDTLNSGQLDPGGTVEGDIVFQVPVGDHNAELTWQPNFFGNSTQNAWKLGL